MPALHSPSAIITSVYPSPAGTLLLGDYAGRLCLCDWMEEHRFDAHLRRVVDRFGAFIFEGQSPLLDRAARLLDEYFNGARREFDIPLALSGTSFQQSVQRVLGTIPYGTTISYAEEAMRLGRPSSVRAVANANAANPISIFIPCHRVIGANKTLTGYGGGLGAKRYLLDLESHAARLF